MGAVAIEINDFAVTVANEAGVLAVEPGYARVDSGRIVTGDQARARARLQPRQTSSRFWSALSMEPGSASADIAKSSAELAYAQLESLWQRAGGPSDVVLVVPGGYRSEQLGLLLGLAQECGMPVRALVDAAAAASVRPYPKRQLVYVDASLHRVSLTLLDQNGEAQVRAEYALAQGLASLADQFARRVADHFVRATRFDPFAHAEAEQAVYDRLPEWLEALQRDERAELSLKYRNEEFKISVERDAILGGVTQGLYRAIIQLIAQHREPGKRLVVQLSNRVAALPGLVGELSRLDDSQIERFPAGHAARSVLRAASIVTAKGDVKLLKRVPWREAPAAEGPAEERREPEPAPVRTRAKPPTHVVYGGFAYRVGADGLVIGREADAKRRTVVLSGSGGVSRQHCEVALRDGELTLRDLSSYGTFVNEKKVAGETTLKRADIIRIGSPGAELHVVDVEGAE
jgi:hypothetical protein